MSSTRKKIFVSAGEYSGSVYIASVIKRLKQSHPDLEFVGIGGRELEEVGVDILYNSDSWGSIGIVEALKRWKLIPINYKIKSYLEEERPDLVVLSDYPGFNMPLARKAKQLGIPSVYIFPPRKFASAPEDIKDAASNIKRVAAEFLPTYEVYKDAGATVDFVGHPMVDSLPELDRDTLRDEFGLGAEEKVVLLMPGSRFQEIELLLPLHEEIAMKLSQKMPGLRFHLLGAQNLSKDPGLSSVLQEFSMRLKSKGVPIELHWEDRFKHMRMADFAIVTSGTATLELACYGVPMVICYKVTSLTAFLARFFNQLPKYIGLPNLLSNQLIVPEFIQEQAEASLIFQHVSEILGSEKELQKIQSNLKEAVSKLGGSGSIGRINDVIIEELGL